MSGPNQWWIPTSVTTTKTIQAHLLRPGADGVGDSALCGRRHREWAQTTDTGVTSYCHACDVLGGVRRVSTRGAIPESRAAGLVAAGWCLRHGHGTDTLLDLLGALLENPAGAARPA